MDADTIRTMGRARTTQEQWAHEAGEDDWLMDRCRECEERVDLTEVVHNRQRCPHCGRPFFSAHG